MKKFIYAPEGTGFEDNYGFALNCHPYIEWNYSEDGFVLDVNGYIWNTESSQPELLLRTTASPANGIREIILCEDGEETTRTWHFEELGTLCKMLDAFESLLFKDKFDEMKHTVYLTEEEFDKAQ